MTGSGAGIWSGIGNAMKVGVVGGTFDPVHNGHLAVAEEARARLDLQEVWFVPAGQPLLRPNDPLAAAGHRVNMVRLAVDGRPYFRVSAAEVERDGPSYTVDTIAEFEARLGGGDELYLILGWDNLAGLTRWREPARLVGMCRLAAANRPGFPLPDIAALDAAIPGLAERVVVLDEPRIDISASMIRGRLARGLSIRDLVPEPVARYIEGHGLYAAE